MCCDGSLARPDEAVGECPVCGAPVDIDGDSVNECCNYSRSRCPNCGDAPCDGSC